MPQGDYLKETVFNIGEVKLEDIIDWEIELNEDSPFPLEYIATSCGCTQITNVDESTGTIKGTLDISKTGTPKTPGIHQVSRVISIYFDDGNKEYTSGDNYKRIVNHDKARERFTLTGTVANPKQVEAN